MNALTLIQEIAALAGYNISGTDTQATSNKARALRRLNQVRADIMSRYSSRWQGNYREAWLPIVPVYNTGTATFTLDSRSVSGTNTVWTSAMVGRKILGPDNAYYKIASVTSTTALILTEPYQSATATNAVYQIWKDEYILYPEAASINSFINYSDPQQLLEDFPKHIRAIAPRSTAAQVPNTYTIIGRQAIVGSYSTGTVTITAGSTSLTGIATSWLGNVYPGYALTIGAYTYHVLSVNSDTSITLYQAAVSAATGATYSAVGRNALVVRFSAPTGQLAINYAYNAKSYPLVNDADEDWLCELYPQVVIDGAMKYDFLDKNDPTRASIASQMLENSIKNAQVSDQSSFTGTSVIGLDIPDSARE